MLGGNLYLECLYYGFKNGWKNKPWTEMFGGKNTTE